MTVNAMMAKDNAANIVKASLDEDQATAADLRDLHKKYLSDIANNHSRESFAALFNYYAPRVKSFLIKGGMSDDAADELAQETMLAVWQKAGQYNPSKSAPSTWIYTILRNKRIDALRRSKGYFSDIDDHYAISDESQDIQDEYEDAQREEMISEVIERLNEEQRDLVQKAFFEGKTHTEIAEETNIPLGTVKSRIRLALKKLEKFNVVKALKDSL